MNVGQAFHNAYQGIQQRWTRLADLSFSRAVPAMHDDTARGEFISAFITERDLTLPAAFRPDRTGR